MNTERVANYWQETFGVTDTEFASPGIRVHRNSGRVAGSDNALIFVHGDSCLISVPSGLVDVVRDRVADVDVDVDVKVKVKVSPEAIFAPKTIQKLFSGRIIERMIGPSYQGYTERNHFRPVVCEKVRRMSNQDRSAIDRLVQACDPTDWEVSGIVLENEPLFGYVRDGEVIALAGIIPWAPDAADPGLITHPAFRGQGYGKAVASAAMAHILDQGNVVLYQTLVDNRPSVRIAQSLGCQQYAYMMFIALQ
jgi:RimJ/RimL family protein N-acetyltransferase